MTACLRLFEVHGISELDDPVKAESRNKIFAPMASNDFTSGLQVYMGALRSFSSADALETYDKLSLSYKACLALMRFSPDCLRRLPFDTLKMRVDAFNTKMGTATTTIKTKAAELALAVKTLCDDAETMMEREVRAAQAKAAAAKVQEEGGPSVDPTAFRSMTVIPSAAELSALTAKNAVKALPPNLCRRYDSPEQLLGTHFHLLREDAINSFREATQIFHTGLNSASGRVDYYQVSDYAWLYDQVTVKEPRFESRDGLGWRVRFSPLPKPRREISWKRTSRLMNGSLLALSRDNFTTIIFATILDRNDEALTAADGPCVDITIAPESTALFDYRDSYMMLESNTYFEAFKPVLKALQTAGTVERPLPFEAILLKHSAEVLPPAYLRSGDAARRTNLGPTSAGGLFRASASAQPSGGLLSAGASQAASRTSVWDISKVFPSYERETGRRTLDVMARDWPVWSHGLDDSQLAAIQHALSSEVACIQGPPGCGKTFVGVNIMRLLLDNPQARRNAPMVVVCYTNHALDSFLELILPHLPTDKKNGLVRVGGRSKSEKLKECSLQNWTKLHGGAYGGVALPGIDRATRDRQFSLRREKKALQEHLHRAFRAWNTEAITEGALDCAGALSWETLPLLVLMARAAEQPRAAAGAAFEDAETEAGTRVTEDGDAFDFDEDDQSFFTSGEDQDGFASVTASETTANRPSSEPPAANVDITSVIERLIVSLRAVENQWSKVVAGLGRGRAKLPTSRGKKRPVALCSLLDRWLHSPRYQQLVVERRNRLQAQQQQRMAAAQHRWMAAIAGQNVISGPSYFAPLGDDGQGDSVIAS